MWELVYADGVVSEVEADVMWRVAHLIGIKEQDRNMIEARVHAATVACQRSDTH